MKGRLLGVIVPLIGALVTVMSGLNSRLAGMVGSTVATLVIHVAGLTAVSVVLLVNREERRPGRLPLHFYLGGFVGVGTVFSSNYAFAAIGASLAVALGLLGQTLLSLAVDATGFMGRKKYPVSARRLPGIALALAGVAVMLLGAAQGSGKVPAVAVLLALAGGGMTGLSFILNSELGRRKGVTRSTRINYLVGLGTTLLIVLIVRPPVVASARAVVAAGPLLVFGGGLMGVVVVTVMNAVFPRLPAVSATLLLFAGQALMGVLVDAAAKGAFDVRKLVGIIILLAGLALNALLPSRPVRAAGRGGSE